MARSAIDPFVIHIFVPLRIQSRAVAPRARSHARWVAAEVRLGQAEAADDLAARHARQPRCLLRFVAPAVDRIHRERALNRSEAAHARIAGFELQDTRCRTQPRSRRCSRSRARCMPEQSQAPELAAQLARQRARFEPLGNVGKHAIAHVRAHGIANEPLFVGEQLRDVDEVDRVGRGRLRGLQHA